jgi:hypothetical protein
MELREGDDIREAEIERQRKCKMAQQGDYLNYTDCNHS